MNNPHPLSELNKYMINKTENITDKKLEENKTEELNISIIKNNKEKEEKEKVIKERNIFQIIIDFFKRLFKI